MGLAGIASHARVRWSGGALVVAVMACAASDAQAGRDTQPPLVTATWVYGDIASCAAAVEDDCDACLAGGTCEPIWSGLSGRDACTMLEAQAAENYPLLCINLAVSLGAVGDCLERDAPACAFDTAAILHASDLRANVRFKDDASCSAPLDACLAELYPLPPSDDGGCCSTGAEHRVGWHWLVALAAGLALARRRRTLPG